MTGRFDARRLPEGGRIDREQPIEFSFDGKQCRGYRGDTLASALVANGIDIVGRSFKLHRPRGVYSAGAEEPCAIVEVERDGLTEPDVRATEIELHPGLVARSVNCWPSARFDLFAIAGAAARVLCAGFYYKTFKWPHWRYFRPVIRRLAGLGKLPGHRDPYQYEKCHAHCDVLVVGAGPAGLVSALVAAQSGARVILVERQPETGGSLLWERATLDGRPADTWLASIEEQIRQRDNVRVLTRSTASGYYDHNLVTINEQVSGFEGRPAGNGRSRERLWRVRAGHVILATGAIERPIVFADNDRPGVMLAGAARQYLNRYAVIAGRNVVVFCNNDSAYRTALDFALAGCPAVTVIDVRNGPGSDLDTRCAEAGIEVLKGHAIAGVSGRRRVSAVEACPLDRAGKTFRDSPRQVPCDLLCVSGGWSPAVHLYSQSGGKLRFDDGTACFRPWVAAQRTTPVGAANGDFSLTSAIVSGAEAGSKAAADTGFRSPAFTLPVVDEISERPLQVLWQVPANLSRVARRKRFVDLQQDVHADDVGLAARENYVSVEHFKRYTTCGMGSDQGKTSNVNALAILGELTGRPPGDVGTTRFRPPYVPVTVGSFAGMRDRSGQGRLYSPARLLPLHDWHVANGGVMEDYGHWKRVAWYRRGDESEAAAIEREVLNTRGAVGLLDYSPLSKIEIRGRDAMELVDRVFANGFRSLAPGRCRYGLVLGENGNIVDDGVVGCLANDHYIVMTTSAGATQMAEWLEQLRQVIWRGLDVAISPQSTLWATLSLTGPKARDVLRKLETDIDLSAQDFPHMAVRCGTVNGAAARVCRVSFTGELGYEISVPVDQAYGLWSRLMAAGSEYGIQPFGIEALEVMRTEKGFLHVGVDTDTTTIPADVGWGHAVARKETEFVGKRSLSRKEQTRAGREQFVGLHVTGHERLPIGSQIVAGPKSIPGMSAIGRVTSSYDSPTLGHPVALGLLANGRERNGETVTVFDRGRFLEARVVAPAFYDHVAERVNA